MSKNFEAVSVPLPSDLPPLELTENARITLRERYLRKNEAGEVTETPEERFWAMSWDIASQEKPEDVEHWAREFYGMMAKGIFMPNSPAIMNSGKGNGNALGACFVLPIEDSIDGIFTTVKNTALVQKAGGGTGFSFDRLRPTGDYISSSSGSTSGPMSFWKVLAEATNSIQQGCFIGSTLIGCPGEDKAIKDIKKGDIVYSFDTVQGSMGYSRAACNAFLTKRGAEVWKLTTDKGLVLFATPDHLMLTRSGEYVPLSQLKKGQRLMPLSRYQKGSDTYVTLQDGKDTRMPEHRLLGKFLYPSYDPKQHDIHHKNGNHQDNHPDNLELMTTSQHHTHHGKLRGSFYEGGQHGDKNGMHRSNFWSTAPDDVKARYRHAIGKGAREDNVMKRPGAAAKHPLFNNEDTKLLAKRGKIVAAACMLKEKGLPVDRGSWPESVKSLYNTYRYKAETVERCFGSWDAFESELSFRNHVVVSTEYSHTEDVWDFEVEGTHNFCVVGQDGKGVVAHNSMRRGANMGMMTITHPDILKFIFAKQDLSAFTNYNVSVKMTDAWMASYKENPDGAHVVINQRNGKRFLIPKTVNKMTYAIQDLIPYEADHTEVKEGSVWTMKEVFDVIIDCAWRTGEPGLFFIDAANKHNPTPHIGAYEATNPCVTGDTPILTDRGFFPIESLVGQKVNVWNGFEWSAVEPRITGENQKLLLVKFSDGSELKCTPYHKFYLQNGEPRANKEPIKKEARELAEGDPLLPWVFPVVNGGSSYSRSEMYTRGFFCGDGSLHQERGKNSLWLYGEKQLLIDHFDYRFANECGNDRTHVALDDSMGWSKTFVPDCSYDVQARLDYFAGLLDSDGTSSASGDSSIWSVDRSFLMEVKMMLHTLGARASVLVGKAASKKLMPDGKGGTKEYGCQRCDRLVISASQMKHLTELGLATNRLTFKFPPKGAYRTTKVVSVEELSDIAEKVYCFTEEKRHMGVFACVATGQCGEQVLLPYESCNLGSINVAKFVKEDRTYDYDALTQYVRTSCRFLDNVVDASPYPIPEIEHMCHTNRKIGLGVMGFADTLFLMGIPYNSEAALAFGEYLMKVIHESSLDYSEVLAEEKGVFPNYGGSLWEKDSVLGRARKMRNAVTTTVAPTGTISIFANCSGGIEPLFNLFFIRQVLNGKRLKELNEHFVKVAKERGFYSEGLLERIVTEGTLKNIAEVPEDVKRVFVCTRDIAPEWHIRMQSVFQKYCGSSISKCIAAGTLIPTSRGLIRVEEIADEHGDDTFLPVGDGLLTSQGHRITQHYHAGFKPSVKVTLDNGSSLTGASGSHRLMTSEGWKLMSDLRVGDLVLGKLQESHGPGGESLVWADALSTNANTILAPKVMSEDFAQFLGMICADGHLTESTGFVGVSTKSDEVRSAFSYLCQSLFGTKVKTTLDKRTGVASVFVTSRNLCRFVKSVIGSGAYGKHAPDSVLRGSKEEKIAFLKGISLDGYLIQNSGVFVVYEGMSERLAYEVGEICRSFGLPKVSCGKKFVPYSNAYAHQVRVTNELQELLQCVDSRKKASSPRYEEYRVFLGDLLDRTPQLDYKHPDYHTLKSLKGKNAKYTDNKTAEKLGLPIDTLAFKVTSVEDAGMVDLYDIEVADVHAYLVNGIESHNTINLPNEATREDVEKSYLMAWELGCKGTTVYRDGCRAEQPMSLKKEEKKVAAPAESTHAPAKRGVEDWKPRRPIKTPQLLSAIRIRQNTPLGNMHVTISVDMGTKHELEIFAQLGKAGDVASSDLEAICRTVSMYLRLGGSIVDVIEQFDGIGTTMSVPTKDGKVSSLADGLSKALQVYHKAKALYGLEDILLGKVDLSQISLKKGLPEASSPKTGPILPAPKMEPVKPSGAGTCPSCKGKLIKSQGCMECPECGFSKCG